VGPRVGLDILEKIEFSHPCPDSNPGPSISQNGQNVNNNNNNTYAIRVESYHTYVLPSKRTLGNARGSLLVTD